MDLLGINRRNAMIANVNTRDAIALANDKLSAKRILREAGVRVPETLMTIAGLSDISVADFDTLPETFVIKPNKGSKGLGIVVLEKCGDAKWTSDAGTWGQSDIRDHLHRIFTGQFSSSGARRDTAFFEEHIAPHPVFETIGGVGLPDIRVICFEGDPVQAMLRLPTQASGGRANLHRGAVGLAIDLDRGTCIRAWHDGREVTHTPGSGEALIGFEVPCWDQVLHEACKSSSALDLGYAGTDCVINTDEEVVTVEVNAFPGIEIQNVNKQGLRSLIPDFYG